MYEPLNALRPTLEGLLADKDKNKQRAAAELIAGLIGGAKHWPRTKQESLWEWLTPKIDKMLGSNVKSDTLLIWTSFLEVRRKCSPIYPFLMN